MYLKELIKLKRGYDLPDLNRIKGIYPIYSSSRIVGYHNEYKIDAPSVITGRSGSLGIVQYSNQKCWPLNTTLYVSDFKNNNPRYVYYLLKSLKLEKYGTGSAVPTLNRNHLDMLNIRSYSLEEQQHIVDIIGSIDDKIENNNKIIKKLEEFGIKNYFKLSNKLEDILLYSKFERGKEASSKNYSEIKQKNFINFIRVKDLNVLTNTYISNSLKLPLVDKKDTIIALDGTVGRTNFGLSGAYSSGLYKVVPVNEKYRGILYFSLKDNFNQNIIQYYATGTTILHAGKSIKHLKIKKHKENDLILFNKLYEFMLWLKQENIKLNNLKQLYLKKFFG